jgi:hypothetical protein
MKRMLQYFNASTGYTFSVDHVIKLLLSKGADVLQFDTNNRFVDFAFSICYSINSSTPLHYSCAKCVCYNAVDIILDSAKRHFTNSTTSGFSLAKIQSFERFVCLGDVNNFTALHYASCADKKAK